MASVCWCCLSASRDCSRSFVRGKNKASPNPADQFGPKDAGISPRNMMSPANVPAPSSSYLFAVKARDWLHFIQMHLNTISTYTRKGCPPGHCQVSRWAGSRQEGRHHIWAASRQVLQRRRRSRHPGTQGALRHKVQQVSTG